LPRWRGSREPHRVPSGHVLTVQPLGNRQIAAGTAQHGTSNSRQHGGKRMVSSLKPAWVRNLRQIVEQAPRGSRIQNSPSMKATKGTPQTHRHYTGPVKVKLSMALDRRSRALQQRCSQAGPWEQAVRAVRIRSATRLNCSCCVGLDDFSRDEKPHPVCFNGARN
jgi:hypothetical protein